MRLILICLLSLTLFTTTGCALFSDSVQKAQEVAAAREAEVATAAEAWEAAGLAVSELIDQLSAATDAGTITMLKDLIVAAVKKREVAEKVYASSLAIFNSAVSDFEDAKSTSDYLGTIFGWLGAGLAGFGIIGGGVQTLRVRRRDDALEGVTRVVEAIKDGGPGKWDDAKDTLRATTGKAALKIIDAARPG